MGRVQGGVVAEIGARDGGGEFAAAGEVGVVVE